jgi:hypothetical protein
MKAKLLVPALALLSLAFLTAPSILNGPQSIPKPEPAKAQTAPAKAPTEPAKAQTEPAKAQTAPAK